MKKIFTEAEVEVKAFEMEDVITVSGEDVEEGGGSGCSIVTPPDRD